MSPSDKHKSDVQHFVNKHELTSNIELYHNKKLYNEFKKLGHDKISFLMCKCSEQVKSPYRYNKQYENKQTPLDS